MSLLQKIEEKKRLQEKEMRNKKVAIATAAAVSGVVVGAVTGILVAPKSGKETIGDIKVKTNETVESTKVKINESKEKIKESAEKVKEYLEARKNNSTEEVVEEVLLIEDQTNEEELEA